MFIDVYGQGLILPIINSLVMNPTVAFLPSSASQATWHFNYGLVIGAFYLFWFFGAIHISKLSDSIGRKHGIPVCLAGALVGYILTILALESLEVKG